MLLLLERGYFRKLMPYRGKEGLSGRQEHSKDGGLSVHYANFLGHLLQSSHSSTNLKAAACRQAIAAQDAEQGAALCAPLLQVMAHGGLFLATYACAALVNLSQAQDTVKSCLMDGGVVEVVLQQLASNDSDLTLYSLMLLVHLTKLTHHRHRWTQAGLVDVLVNILTSTYGVLQYKHRIITELCSVLGQMCNHEETREKLCDLGQSQVIECLLHVFETAEGVRRELPWSEARPSLGDEQWGPLPAAAAKVTSKVLFTLKQLAANTPSAKELIGRRAIWHIVLDLRCEANLEHLDWALNAITLLVLLAVSRRNVDLILDANWPETLRVLSGAEGCGETMRHRIAQIEERVADFAPS